MITLISLSTANVGIWVVLSRRGRGEVQALFLSYLHLRLSQRRAALSRSPPCALMPKVLFDLSNAAVTLLTYYPAKPFCYTFLHFFEM